MSAEGKEIYDVFISHSHTDAESVEDLAKRLEDIAGLHVWLDKWILVPGEPWRHGLAHGLNQARSCAVCIGENTPKGWFQEEIGRALNRQTQDPSFRVIPVLLPKAKKCNVDDFLGLRTWVDFKKGIDDNQTFHLLVSGIRGMAPGRGPQEEVIQKLPSEHEDEKPPEFLVSGTTAGFVGLTERGPTQPQFVHSWTEYRRIYGDEIDSSISFLPHSIKGFFENGGCYAFIVRIVGKDASKAKLNLPPNLYIEALNPGIWGNRIYIKVQKGTRIGYRLNIYYYQTDQTITPTEPENFSVQMFQNLPEPDIKEDYDNLSFEFRKQNYAYEIVNRESNLVRLEFCDSQPVQLSLFNNFIPMKGGSDGSRLGAKDYIGNTSDQNEASSGLSSLEEINGISILCVPDQVHPGLEKSDQKEIMTAMINQCQLLNDRFAILSVCANESDVNSIESPPDTSYAAMYYPWIRVFDSHTKSNILVPAVGHISGIYAQNDAQRGVHRAPVNILIRGISQNNEDNFSGPLEFDITSEQQDVLNRKGINVVRNFGKEMFDIRLTTALTMSIEEKWKYVHVRRFILYLIDSIIEGTQWIKFELNDEEVWDKVRKEIIEFLTRTWKEKALGGLTPKEAFFVKCDRSTMTQGDIDNGRLICVIGVFLLDTSHSFIFDLELKTTDYSLAIKLIDEYTNAEPVGNVRVAIRDRDKNAVKNLNGYYLFTNIEEGEYTIIVYAENYFLRQVVVDTSWFNGRENTIVVNKHKLIEVILKPLPSYPFPSNATLVRGVIVWGEGENRGFPVYGARIKVPRINLETNETNTDARGGFVLYFRDIKKEDITIEIERDGYNLAIHESIEEGKPKSLGTVYFPFGTQR